MDIAITVVHVIACFFLIIVVLLQTGKGADMGAVFGGSSQTVFGSGGAGNFLQRMTTGIAIAFFLTSFGLAFYAKEKSQAARGVGIPVVVEAPVLGVQQDDEGELPAFESLEQDSEIPEG